MSARLLLTILLAVASAQSPNGVVSVSVPDGWRQVAPTEMRRLKPELQPQNKMQQHLQEKPSINQPLIVLKHDTEQGLMAASAQLFVSDLPATLRGATSMEAARVLAFETITAFGGKYEVEPREITAGGFPAAEWIASYQIVEKIGGTHDMRARGIVIARGEKLYLLGYSGPASDTADFSAFDSIVKSIRFGK